MENIMFEGQVFAPVETNLFRGWEPVKLSEAPPNLAWKGKKIPLSVWYPLSAFMRKFCSDECMARFYYHAELGWKAWVWPQKFGTGMTVSEIGNHPLRRAQWTEQFGAGWDAAGTLHHHCNASAFQSGTDREDEIAETGLHITLGQMTKPTLDIHTRAAFRGAFLKAPLENWFEMPPEVAVLPPGIQGAVLGHYILACLPGDVTWPKEWEGNLIETPRIPWAKNLPPGFAPSTRPSTPVGETEGFPEYTGPAYGFSDDACCEAEMLAREGLERLLRGDDPATLFYKNLPGRAIDPEYIRDIGIIADECGLSADEVGEIAFASAHEWADDQEREREWRESRNNHFVGNKRERGI